MTILDLIVLLLIAGVCGALGQAISGFSRGGCLVSIALGFVGAVLGMWLARQLGLPELFPIRIGTTSFPIIWSIIGSALFVAVIALLTRSRGGVSSERTLIIDRREKSSRIQTADKTRSLPVISSGSVRR